jgi:hypothetical protein
VNGFRWRERLVCGVGVAGVLSLAGCSRGPNQATAAGLGVERFDDTTGQYQTITRGLRTLILTMSNADSGLFSVLEERTEIRCCAVSEHPTSTAVTLSRLDHDPDGTTHRAWSWTGSLDAGELWHKFYRGTEWGCCDALDLGTLVSVESGSTTLHYAHESELGGETPTWFELPDQGIARYFGYIEPYQFETADSGLRRKAFAIIEMSDGATAPRKWALFSPDRLGSCCRFGSLRLLASDSTGPGRKYMNRWDRPAGRTYSVSGFDVVISLLGYDDPDVELRIPVRDDALDTRGVRGPAGWRLEKL